MAVAVRMKNVMSIDPINDDITGNSTQHISRKWIPKKQQSPEKHREEMCCFSMKLP